MCADLAKYTQIQVNARRFSLIHADAGKCAQI